MDFQTLPKSFSLNLQFYSTPSSPIPVISSRPDDNYERDNEFEFDTTPRRTVTNFCEFHQQITYPDFIGWTTAKGNDNENIRSKSFCNLPLKPPPRLQSAVSTSPCRSPNSLPRFPFVRTCSTTWNDDFDPFQVALEKVSEETRARMSFHRRSLSCSAYNRTSGHVAAHGSWLDGSVDHWTKERRQGLMNRLKPKGPTTLAKLMERRESVYLRRPVPNDDEPSRRVEPRSKSSRVVRRDMKDDEPMKSRSESSSLQRVISTMKKARKTSWKLRRCLGYAPGSPPFMK